MIHRMSHTILTLTAAMLVVGCASKPPERTGFLSEYSKLKKRDDGALRYIGPELKNYQAYMVDPVQIRAQKKSGGLTSQQRAEVARYFNQSLAKELKKRGYNLVEEPGEGVARVRLALTDIQESTWWMNVHPASKVSGVGKGGASMEGEVIDSVTGEQLAAVVQAGKGNQFELDTFSKLDDVKDTIDGWTRTMGERLDQFRKERAAAERGVASR